jgi:tetratricopeptide (TPR) repeat protein
MTLRFLVVFMIVMAEGAAFAAPSAEELFDQGQTSFTKGDYASAVARWNESYGLSKEPELLFNIAQALRLDGRCEEALATYQRFITIAPGSQQRPLADELVRELTAKCGAANATPRQPRENPDEDPRRDRDLVEDHDKTHPSGTWKIVGLTIAGAGVVSLATGLYFGHRASSLGEEVTSACQSGCAWAVYGSKDAEGRRAETKQYVFVGIGGAAIIGGGVIYWLASRTHVSAPIVIAPRRDGAAFTWSGSW